MSYYTLIIRFAHCYWFLVINNYQYRQRKLFEEFYLCCGCHIQVVSEIYIMTLRACSVHKSNKRSLCKHGSLILFVMEGEQMMFKPIQKKRVCIYFVIFVKRCNNFVNIVNVLLFFLGVKMLISHICSSVMFLISHHAK